MTRVWFNPLLGHHFAQGDDGCTLNGMPTVGVPEWAEGRPPDAAYGPVKPWAGGACPVSPDADVRCIFRGRRPYLGKAIWPGLPERYKGAMWLHSPAPGRTDPTADIVGYQVRTA